MKELEVLLTKLIIIYVFTVCVPGKYTHGSLIYIINHR